MFIAGESYGKPNLGKNVSIVGQANFGSEPYLITIGDNTIIGANSTVIRSCPPNSILVGSPAKNK